MNLLIKQLQSVNICLGTHKKFWNNNMSLFVTGLYNDIFCLNIYYTQLILRKVLNIFKKTMLKYKTVFFIVPLFVLLHSWFKQGLKNVKPLAWNLKNLSIFTLVTWFFGLLTNFKLVNKNYKILPLNHIPDMSVILVNKITETTDPINIARESTKMHVLNFGLVDSSQNPYTFNYAIPSNSKAFETIMFFYRFFCSYFFILNVKIYSNFFEDLIYFRLRFSETDAIKQ